MHLNVELVAFERWACRIQTWQTAMTGPLRPIINYLNTIIININNLAWFYTIKYLTLHVQLLILHAIAATMPVNVTIFNGKKITYPLRKVWELPTCCIRTTWAFEQAMPQYLEAWTHRGEAAADTMVGSGECYCCVVDCCVWFVARVYVPQEWIKGL